MYRGTSTGLNKNYGEKGKIRYFSNVSKSNAERYGYAENFVFVGTRTNPSDKEFALKILKEKEEELIKINHYVSTLELSIKRIKKKFGVK